MITVASRLVQSQWFHVHGTGSGIVVNPVLIHELRPLAEANDVPSVDEYMKIYLVIIINFDGLIYKIDIEDQTIISARELDEALLLTQRASLVFTENGDMTLIEIDGRSYEVADAELLGCPTNVRLQNDEGGT